MKILITSGATREPIDKVRFITNFSTGRTGANLANSLAEMGHDVTYLHGEGALLPDGNIKGEHFLDFQSLDQKLKELLSHNKFEVVIHLAAVSDYSVDRVFQNGSEVKSSKLNSDTAVELRLRPNYKILNRIKSYAIGYEPLVVGFKLTYTNDSMIQQQAIEKLFSDGNIDLVVHNDLKEIQETSEHKFHIYKNLQNIGTYLSPKELAIKLNEMVGEVL